MRIVLLATVLASGAFGQQTIFNVPSADIAARGDWFFQHQTTARTWSPGRFWTQTNAFGYGIGHHVELDATWYNLDFQNVGASIASFGGKVSVPLRRDAGRWPVQAVIGDMITFRERTDPAQPSPRDGNWLYAMASTEVPKVRSRVTLGATDGTRVLFGAKESGLLGGWEQPLSKRWTFQADWFSGRHDLAYWIPGVVYRMRTRWMVSVGIQNPNHRAQGSRAVVLELTRF